MPMSPRVRKFALTAHITFSVGWFGAVAVFLALALAGLTSQNAQLVQAAYVAMALSAWFVIVPASFGAFSTGLIQSLGTQWGLFKHYWVVVKLLLTVIATGLLLLHMEPVSYLAEIASQITPSGTEFRSIQLQLVGDASAALFVLGATIAISVYKPWGLTPYGIRKQQAQAEMRNEKSAKRSQGFYILIGLLVLGVLIAIIHLLGGGLGNH
ncbi:MAG: hypothetical protein L0Y80_09380 [Ignavibacteriae bacterium]|nr:hypothetical protein [Ignavibacteriota bacterium]